MKRSNYKKGRAPWDANPTPSADIKRQSIVLPEKLHSVVREVSFREDIRLTVFVTEALYAFFNGDRDIELPNAAAVCGGKDIHTSIYMPVDLMKQMRSVSHYQKVTIKDLLSAAIRERLKDLSAKYGDVIEGNI